MYSGKDLPNATAPAIGKAVPNQAQTPCSRVLLGKIKFALQNQEFFHALRDHKIHCRVRKDPQRKISWVIGESTETDLEEAKTQILGEWATVLWLCILKFLKYIKAKKEVARNFFKSSATARYSAQQRNETRQADTRPRKQTAHNKPISR